MLSDISALTMRSSMSSFSSRMLDTPQYLKSCIRGDLERLTSWLSFGDPSLDGHPLRLLNGWLWYSSAASDVLGCARVWPLAKLLRCKIRRRRRLPLVSTTQKSSSRLSEIRCDTCFESPCTLTSLKSNALDRARSGISMR